MYKVLILKFSWIFKVIRVNLDKSLDNVINKK